MEWTATSLVSTVSARAAETKGQSRRVGPLPERLTRIELEILGLLNLGLTNREIADSLSMTVGTIKWYMNQIFGKLQVRNRIEALARARDRSAVSSTEAVPYPIPMGTPPKKIELDILSLLNDGLTNREIASNLALTIGTTRWRISQIFGKLRARNRIEALARARQFEWL
ncbi:MAG TPA: LuxR C-terminal-related transcriptional regulator [Casimicrobiaceae bacterium]|nr:LuxR C-terminal-related transcriptional regulator [Casimicrobiaceae bacterium]